MESSKRGIVKRVGIERTMPGTMGLKMNLQLFADVDWRSIKEPNAPLKEDGTPVTSYVPAPIFFTADEATEEPESDDTESEVTFAPMYMPRLSVTDGNLLHLSAGEMVVADEEGNLSTASVDGDGALSVSPMQIDGESVMDNSISGSKLMEGAITARELDVDDLFSDSTLLNQLVASKIDTEELFINDEFIGKLTDRMAQAVTQRIQKAAASEAETDELRATLTEISQTEITNSNTGHSGAEPPANPSIGQCWEYTGVTPPEILTWTGKGSSTARRYPASKSGLSVTISDLSDDRALGVTAKTVATQDGSGIPSPQNIRNIVGKASVKIGVGGTDTVLSPTVDLYGLTGFEDEIGNDGHEKCATALLSLTGQNNDEVICYAGVDADSATHVQFIMNRTDNTNKLTEGLDNDALICSHMPYSIDAATAGSAATGVRYLNGSTMAFCVPKEVLPGWQDASTPTEKVTAFKAWLAGQKSNNKPVQILYVRAAAATPEPGTAVAINGQDGEFTVTGDCALMAVTYTGTGWKAVGGTQCLVSNVVSITPEQGIRVNQYLPGNEEVPFYTRIGAQQFGVYRASDDKAIMEAGADEDGKGYVAVNRMRDPQASERTYVRVYGDEYGSASGLEIIDTLEDGSTVSRGRLLGNTNNNLYMESGLGGSSVFLGGLDSDSACISGETKEGDWAYAAFGTDETESYDRDGFKLAAFDVSSFASNAYPRIVARLRQRDLIGAVRYDGGERTVQTYTDITLYSSRSTTTTEYHHTQMYQGWYTGIGPNSIVGRMLFNIPSGGSNLTGKRVTRIQFTLTCTSAGSSRANKVLSIYDTNYPTSKAVDTATGVQFARDLLGTITGRFYGNTITFDADLVYNTLNITDSSGASTPEASGSLVANLRSWLESGGRTLALYNEETARGTESASYSDNYLGVSAWAVTVTYADVEPYTMRSVSMAVGEGNTHAELKLANGPARGRINTAGDIVPCETNVDKLGDSALRFKNAYLVSGPSVSSDERLKRNIRDLEEGLAFILALQPIEYEMIFESEGAPRHMGFKAQQVRQALIEAGYGERALVDVSNPDQWALVYHELIAPLVCAIQAQQCQIGTLAARVEALEGIVNVS